MNGNTCHTDCQHQLLKNLDQIYSESEIRYIFN